MLDLTKDIDNIISETEDSQNESIFQKFEKERFVWLETIKGLNQNMKNLSTLSELMVDIYTQRQLCVEYYHHLLSKLSSINKKYRKEFTTKYDFYTYKSQKRFPNEKTKELQILAELSEIVNIREALDNHAKFMNETKNTIDNIIYGIKYKVDIEKINRGSL